MSRRWGAIAVAYLLVLQALFAGLASGVTAATVSLDRELALTLCASAETGPVGADHGGAAIPHADQNCCTAACPMLAGGEPPEAGFEPVIHRAADQVAFSRRLDRPSGFLAGRSSANPRAPPVQV